MQNISLILKGVERLRIKEIRQMGVEKKLQQRDRASG